MLLDPATQKVVEDWLRAHCPNVSCPACGGVQFGGAVLAYSNLAQTPIPPGGGLRPPPPPQPSHLPLVHLFCASCGYALAFSAYVMGVTGPPPWAAGTP
jgi:hypothetical protein